MTFDVSRMAARPCREGGVEGRRQGSREEEVIPQPGR
jgi:hypothetical protein